MFLYHFVFVLYNRASIPAKLLFFRYCAVNTRLELKLILN